MDPRRIAAQPVSPRRNGTVPRSFPQDALQQDVPVQPDTTGKERLRRRARGTLCIIRQVQCHSCRTMLLLPPHRFFKAASSATMPAANVSRPT
ncbi:hypothetical protein DTW90_32440 [Neorhizobium sp. P12A]|nr:hypothetical protein DTW90_32440 [Neorhizobium sp. P12A]